jgi:hypothetical protein
MRIPYARILWLLQALRLKKLAGKWWRWSILRLYPPGRALWTGDPARPCIRVEEQ